MNGFEDVKSANKYVEDDAIALIMKSFATFDPLFPELLFLFSLLFLDSFLFLDDSILFLLVSLP